MDKISFQIFEPDGKFFHWTPNWILSVLAFPPMLLLWAIKGDNSGPPAGWIIFYIISVGVLAMYFLISSFFTHASLHGILNGKIEFEKGRFIVNKKVFELKNINDIDFFFYDYYEMSSIYDRSFNPKLSQGVGNYISFVDTTAQSQKIYFQMLGKHSFLSLSDFINEAIKMKKMNHQRGIDLLGIENIETS